MQQRFHCTSTVYAYYGLLTMVQKGVCLPKHIWIAHQMNWCSWRVRQSAKFCSLHNTSVELHPSVAYTASYSCKSRRFAMLTGSEHEEPLDTSVQELTKLNTFPLQECQWPGTALEEPETGLISSYKCRTVPLLERWLGLCPIGLCFDAYTFRWVH